MVKTNLVILFELLYGSLKILSLAVWNLLGRCALRHASCLGYCLTLPLDSSLVERDWCKTDVGSTPQALSFYFRDLSFV